LRVDSSPAHVRLASTGGITSLMIAVKAGHVAIARALIAADPG
jgi:hypothetical protein